MRATEKSHAETAPKWAATPARARVTDTHGPFEVGEFRVLRVGHIVALHFGTPAGRIVVHVRERSFVKHARAECDDQGNRFRSLQEIDAERLAAEAVPGPEPVAPSPPRDACADAWDFLLLHLHWRVIDVAHRFGIEPSRFHAWVQRHHPRQLVNLRRTRGISPRGEPQRGLGRDPVLKPGGKLL